MNVVVYNQQRDITLSKKSIALFVEAAVDLMSVKTDEVVLHFVTERKISKLHQDIFDDPSPTDCITCPIDGLSEAKGVHVLGESFICPKAALDWTKEDPKKELSRYVIHTLLHMCGMKDTTPLQKKRMRLKENSLLGKLRRRGISL